MIATPASAERVQKCIFDFEIYRFLKKRSIYPILPYLGYRSSPSLLPSLVGFIVNDFALSGILAWLRACLYRGAQAIDILLIFSSLDGTSSVRLKLCCTAAPRLLIHLFAMRIGM